jgi:hypothetical protein
MSILVGKVRDKWSDKKKSFLIYIKWLSIFIDWFMLMVM